jgi:hypothetical protein
MIIKLETDLVTPFILIEYLQFCNRQVSDEQGRVGLHALSCRLGNVSDGEINRPGLLATLLGG